MYIEGRIQSRKYTGKDGIERTAYDIIGNEMKMLGSKSDNAGGGSHYEQQGGGHYDQSHDYGAQAQHSVPPSAPRRQEPKATPAPVDDIDDDIPF